MIRWIIVEIDAQYYGSKKEKSLSMLYLFYSVEPNLFITSFLPYHMLPFNDYHSHAVQTLKKESSVYYY